MGTMVHSLSSNRPSSGAKVRAVRSRRRTSRARFFAVAISHVGGVLRQSAEFPHLERAAEGVLHHVFRQREVLDSKDARQRGDHAPRFAPKQMVAGMYHMFIFMTGRTSTAPSTSKIGQPLESSTAWSRSRASISV